MTTPTSPTPPTGTTAIGVIVPCDMALDRELWRWTPDDVDLYVTRLPLTPTDITLETVALMGNHDLVAASIASLLPVEPATMLYACTSGSFVHGPAGERALRAAMDEAGASNPVTTSGALSAAAQHLGLRSVAIATPYDVEITDRLADYLAGTGIEVLGRKNLAMHEKIWTVPYDVVAGLIRDADVPEADGVLVSCTNLPTYGVIAALEAELGKPVITANQASMWAALAATERHAVGPGQTLLESPLPLRAELTATGLVREEGVR
jgi:maleate isomerase